MEWVSDNSGSILVAVCGDGRITLLCEDPTSRGVICQHD